MRGGISSSNRKNTAIVVADEDKDDEDLDERDGQLPVADENTKVEQVKSTIGLNKKSQLH